MQTPWEKAQERLGARRRTQHQQSEIQGARGGGASQINSGRFWFSKRDFKKFDFIFENRQTNGKTITVNAQELKKINREGIFEDSLPAMRLDFTRFGEDWTLIRTSDFEDFFREFKMLQAVLENERDNKKD